MLRFWVLLICVLFMESVLHKWVLAFQLFCWLPFPTAFSGSIYSISLFILFILKKEVVYIYVCNYCVGDVVEGIRGDGKVRAVNLGGWLVIEGWIKPSLFDGIPNGDMLVNFS